MLLWSLQHVLSVLGSVSEGKQRLSVTPINAQPGRNRKYDDQLFMYQSCLPHYNRSLVWLVTKGVRPGLYVQQESLISEVPDLSLSNDGKHEQRLWAQKIGWSFPDFWQTGQGRNVGQQNSLVAVKLHFRLTPQASNRWCFNNKYLGKAPLNWITLV